MYDTATHVIGRDGYRARPVPSGGKALRTTSDIIAALVDAVPARRLRLPFRLRRKVLLDLSCKHVVSNLDGTDLFALQVINRNVAIFPLMTSARH